MPRPTLSLFRRSKMAVFNACIAFTLANEGGFVDNPRDPGGATNFGVTLDGLSDWRGARCSVADVRDMTVAEATAIYHANYWIPVAGDDLAPGLDLMVFDFGVNHGPASAVELLQWIVGAHVDGDAGVQTIARASCSSATLNTRIRALATAQSAFYTSLRNPVFNKGWQARTQRRQAAALVMAAKTGASA